MLRIREYRLLIACINICTKTFECIIISHEENIVESTFVVAQQQISTFRKCPLMHVSFAEIRNKFIHSFLSLRNDGAV